MYERDTNGIGTLNVPSDSIALSSLEFEGDTVEFLEVNGEKWYTGYAVGKIVDYPYKRVTQLVRRKSQIFEGLAESHTMQLSGKLQSVLCFNRDGILTFLNEVNWPSLKPEERKQKVIRFRRWMIQTIGKVIDHELLPATSPTLLSNIVQDRIDTCRKIAAAVGCDLSTLLNTELALIEEQTGQPIACLNQLPLQNPIRKAAVFTETELGKQFNVTGRKIQIILKDKGYLQSIGGRLDFTHIGLLFGDWRPGIENKGRPRTMARMRRFWNQDIVPKLEEHFYYMQKAKEGLFLGELQVIS
jgi:hypothetical protein